MPKKLFRRVMPDTHSLKQHKHLKLFGALLHDANLWHLNRRSAAGAFAVGLFVAWLPIPFQMLIAATGAIFFRVNLPISVALVWLSNPITMPPLFYGAYRLGALLIGKTLDHEKMDLSLHFLMSAMGDVGPPFIFGCLVLGTFCSIVGYLSIRTIWRISIMRSWERRKARRLEQQKH